jgi:hypothetical protein
MTLHPNGVGGGGPDERSSVPCTAARQGSRRHFGFVIIIGLAGAAWLWMASGAVAAGAQFGWRAADVDRGHKLTGVSCASISLCVAFDAPDVEAPQGEGPGNVVTSTDPTAGAAAWKLAHVDPHRTINSVSCPSTSLCVAVDNAGNVLTSTDPTGGAGAWTLAAVDPGTDTGVVSSGLTGVSCPSVSLCVAVDIEGDVLTSTNPTGGAAAWSRPLQVSSDGAFKGVSCATTSMCAAVTWYGSIAASTNPTGGAAAWSHFVVANEKTFEAVSCPSPVLCVVVGRIGGVVTSTNPTGGAAAWTTAADVDPGEWMFHASCASASFCAASDGSGNLVTSTDPTGGAQTWRIIPPPEYGEAKLGVGGISCPSASLCVGVSGAIYPDGYVLVGGPGISGGAGISGAPSTRGGSGTRHACVVPRLVGKTRPAAEQALRHGGCRVGKVRRVKTSRHKRGRVLSQSVAAGRRLRARATVNVVVGR